jgi:hypothetical protein
MQRLKVRIAAATIAAGLASIALPAAAQSYYTVNGRPPSYDVAIYMAQNGLPAGDYWLDTQGYWGVMGNWQPLGNINPGSTVSVLWQRRARIERLEPLRQHVRYVGGRRQQRLLLRQRLVELLMPARRQPGGAK